MKVILALSLACAFATPGFSQLKTVVTPAGYDKQESPGMSWMFGSYPGARFQFAEGDMKGAGVKKIVKVGYRKDQDFFLPMTGHSWTQVTLDCAETKIATISVTFAKNPIRTPVRVFAAAVTWPTTTGARLPTVFAKAYSFPFAKPFLYTGVDDILLDYQFTGGVLATRAPWSNLSGDIYILDAVDGVPSLGAIGHWISGRRGPSCQDGGHSLPGTCHTEMRVFPKRTYLNPTHADKIGVAVYTNYTAKLQPVVQVLDFAGDIFGVPLPGVSCNNLHLALTPAVTLFYGVANAATGSMQTLLGYFPWKSSYAYVPIYTQALWHDSVSKKPMLSQAFIATVPQQPLDHFARHAIVQTNPALVRQFGLSLSWNGANPMSQWTY